jgi:glycosyltransferase involved in cell wall biosynthesis
MHIAFFISSLPEPDRKPGGVDAHVERLAERLAGRGHHVDVYTYSPGPKNAGYHRIQLQPEGLRYNRLARMMVIPCLLNRLTPAADVLHLHGDDWFYLRRQLPTVRTFYGSALWEARTAVRMRRKISCRMVFGGEILASRLATASYDIAPGSGRAYASVGTLPPAVEVEPLDIRRASQPTILFVGTWSGRKRGWLVADVFQRKVLPQIPQARLLMVSDRIEPAPGIEHVVRPSNAELTQLMHEAWVMCLPSTYEGFGIPYAEALAAGTTVVAAPNLGARYVLDEGRAGVISRDADLGASLVRVLQDPDLRECLASRGRERVQEFAWERVLNLHEVAYDDARARWAMTSR